MHTAIVELKHTDGRRHRVAFHSLLTDVNAVIELAEIHAFESIEESLSGWSVAESYLCDQTLLCPSLARLQAAHL